MISDEFKKVLNGETPNEEFLVPLMRWLSGDERNIEAIQDVNKKFTYVNRKILISEVTLKNSVKHFIKFPKVLKDDPKLRFFYNDLCSYLGWTTRELKTNFDVIDINSLKEEIAIAYGYDNNQRRLLGVKQLEVLKNAKRGRKTGRQNKKLGEFNRKN